MNTESAPEILIDKICIQWINERREGRTISLSDYLKRYPLLNQPEHLLDLIDADLCICHERGEPVDVNAYTVQFPEIADQIRLLVELESFDRMASSFGSQPDDSLGSDGSTESSLAGVYLSADPLPTASIKPANLPVAVPEMFLANEIILASPGHWLVRGRHLQSGQPLALKVLSIDRNVKSARLNEVLDVCEAAAGVKHPSWIAPQMAFIENRHLGVVRPWLFAAAVDPSLPISREMVLQRIGLVATTLQAAHDLGATHGCVTASNLLTDHSGNVLLVDGASSGQGWKRSWQGDGSLETHLANFASRRAEDVRGLLRWIATLWIDNDWFESSLSWSRLHQMSKDRDPQCCAAIADLVFQSVHQDREMSPAPSRRWWNRTGSHL